MESTPRNDARVVGEMAGVASKCDLRPPRYRGCALVYGHDGALEPGQVLDEFRSAVAFKVLHFVAAVDCFVLDDKHCQILRWRCTQLTVRLWKSQVDGAEATTAAAVRRP